MRFWWIVIIAVFVTACGQKQPPVDETRKASNKPYRVNGQWYYPLLKADGYDETGMASWYGRDFHGKKTSSGETYDMHGLSAAHPTLPMGTMVRVTNLENGKHIDLRINDRGPFVKDRLIDLSYAAAKKLGYAEKGTARVRVQALSDGAPAPVKVTHYVAPPKTKTAAEASGSLSPLRSLPEVITTAQADEVTTEKTVTSQVRRTPKAPAWQPATPPTVSKQAATPYYVQLGAFVSRTSAEKLRQQYLRDYPQLRLFVDDAKTPVVYKVRQGPFSRRDQAELLAARMEMNGITQVSLVSDDLRPLIATPAAQSPSPAAPQDLPAPMSSSDNMNRQFVTSVQQPAPASVNSVTAAHAHAVSSEQKGRVYVQIGAFSSMQRAVMVRDRYQSRYPNIAIHAPHPGDAKIYRVRIGPFDDVNRVGAVVEELERSGIDKAIVVVGK